MDRRLINQRLVLMLCSLGTAAAQAGIAEIVGLSGKGEYRPDGESAWREAKLKTQIEPAGWVRTGTSSSMALLVDPETQVKLAANSIFQLKREEKSTGTTLQLRQGRAWSQSKQPGKIKMETPSAIAAIHGTDWEMDVDTAGRATLTVIHGQVQFGNAQGSVMVGNGEQALAEPGKAPVKRVIANPAERVQWVSAFRIDPARHGSAYRDSRVVDLLAASDWDAAATLLDRLPDPLPADRLLRADLAILAGDYATAATLLEQGSRQPDEDGRFAAAQARLSLLKGAGAQALETARAVSTHFPQSAASWLVLGEAARFEGLAGEARTAFTRAALLDPTGQAHLGLGRIAAERGDISSARSAFAEAKRRGPDLPDLAGEQGSLETGADRWAAAHAHFDTALAQDAQDYVALAGLAQLLLRQGDNEGAMAASLRANLLEPRLARAYLSRAVIHQRRGESATALEFLRQATERDPKDPLPHFMASLILQDRGELFGAANEARIAKQKLPFLKSLDPLAMDQKGSANIGSALAKLGLTDWARYYAHESYDPLWAGSHFFLSDQYSGKFAKNSELMQGFLSDPLAFGAGNRMQSLVPTPGTYLTLGARTTRSDALHLYAPSLVANGSHYLDMPVAWFFEGLRLDYRPGAEDLTATSDAYTLALGAKPRHDISLFLFANRNRFDYEGMGSLYRERISGPTGRIDVGGSFRFDPDTTAWLKAGQGEAQIRTASLGSVQTQDQDGTDRDVQFRTTWRAGGHALHAGLETAATEDRVLTQGSRSTSVGKDSDDSRLAYIQGRWAASASWDLEAALAWADYRKRVVDIARHATLGIMRDETTHYQQERTLPAVGMVWRPLATLAVRGLWIDWLRSNAAHSLRPPALAGIPVDDQLTLPGGRLQRQRLQADWELAQTAFMTAFLDIKKIRNLGDPGPFLMNTTEETASLNRLRDRSQFQHWGDAERLEAQPLFAAGQVKQAGLIGNAMLGNGFSGTASYLHSRSRNTHDFFKNDDFPLPYLPRHRVGFGLDWSNEARLTAGGQLVWRSTRLTEEGGGTALPASWDLALRMKWESADKRLQLETWATNLLKKNDDATLGMAVQLRF